MVTYAISLFAGTKNSESMLTSEETIMHPSNREQSNRILKNSDNPKTSTMRLAKRHNISGKFLFEYLLANDYLRKLDSNFIITEKGYGVGGSYIEYKNSRGVGWSGTYLDEIIKNCCWPIDIKKKFSAIQKNVSERLDSSGADIDYLHGQTNNGRKILESQEELDSYIRSYGLMHKEKMTNAYRELNKRADLRSLGASHKFQLVDYACGQGLASIVFVEYLKSIGITHQIDAMILVEPSRIALETGADHFTGPVKKVNKHLDNLGSHDIATSDDHIKFHLFSNILDMGDEYFDLKGLAKTILSSQKGTNYFICVSPLGRYKLDDFMGYFEGHIEISSFSGEISNPSTFPGARPWQVVWNIFRVEL